MAKPTTGEQRRRALRSSACKLTTRPRTSISRTSAPPSWTNDRRGAGSSSGRAKDRVLAKGSARPPCPGVRPLGVCPTGIRAVVGHDGIIDDGTVREFGGDPSLHSGSDLRLIAIPSLLAVAGSLVLGSACYPTVASGTIPAIRRRFNASVTKLHSPWTLRSPRSENCRNPNLAFNHPKTGSTSPLRRA